MQIAMLLSGGVDSSVAMVELLQAGHIVEAYYIKVWLEGVSALGNCPWQEDVAAAQAVCKRYGVSLRVLSLQEEYYRHIVQHTLRELQRGATPSPDVLCNSHIKFGLFLQQLASRVDYIASGHYARIMRRREALLYQAQDRTKDQSYFLFHLRQEQISRLLFPLGDSTKQEVRQRALRYRLPNAGRPDSQGLCFLGSIRFRDFVNHYLGEAPGEIVDEYGAALGHHRGHWFYTIGQRQALGLSGGPWYVIAKQIAENRIVVSHQPAIHQQRRLKLDYLHFNAQPPTGWLGRWFSLKLRHGPRHNLGRIRALPHNGYAVELRQPDSIAPGQYAVFYNGQRCIGGGQIATL